MNKIRKSFISRPLAFGLVLMGAGVVIAILYQPYPAKSSASLMPKEFENIYLGMTPKELVESREDVIEIGPRDGSFLNPIIGRPYREDTSGTSYFESINYGFSWGGGLLASDPKLREVEYYMFARPAAINALLRGSILRYGSKFEKHHSKYSDNHKDPVLVWKYGNVNIQLDLRFPTDEKSYGAGILSVDDLSAGERALDWGVQDKQDVEKAFAPFQATIDQAVNDLRSPEGFAGRVRAREARQRWTRLALYSGLVVVLILATVIAYRRFIRKPKHDSQAA